MIWIVFEWLKVLYRRLPVALKPPLQLLAAALAVQVLVGGTALWGINPVLITAGVSLLAVYAVFGLLLGKWSVSQFVPGAADNASGSAAVLTLGEAWLRNPVAGVELVLLLTGCEEVGMLGAAAWADRHRAEIRALPTLFLNVDSLCFGPPRFLGWEVPVVGWPVACPAEVIAAVETVAAEQGLANAGPHSLPGPTDGLAFLKRGVAGVTVVGFQDRGRLPNYHRMLDTSDTRDYGAACAGGEFAWELLWRWRRTAAVRCRSIAAGSLCGIRGWKLDIPSSP